MSLLFGVSTENIGLHISNILKENELDSSTTEGSSVVQQEGNLILLEQVHKNTYVTKMHKSGNNKNLNYKPSFRRWL